MNILIISFDADPPFMGGVATMANLLGRAFMAEGHFCALGFMDDSAHPSVFFQHKVKLVEKNRLCIEKFFNQHHFDIILNQLPTLTDFRFLASLSLGDCRIVSAYHSRPMLHPIQLHHLLKVYNGNNNLIYKLYTLSKIPLLPLMRFMGKKRELDNYRNICFSSDKILLLSDKFFPNWINLMPETDKKKLVSIGNPLVFDESFSTECNQQKEFLVIVVANLDHVKRGNVLLRIWEKIEADPNMEKWSFELIGGGDELDILKKLAKKLKLKRIKFVGSSNSFPYYERAQILMMASKYEGWPMVLMEAQQMGVIPISFNSFESITDIINDGENGLIIPNNDINCFIEKMKQLMLNQQERKRMSENAIRTSSRFNKENVVQQYLSMFVSTLSVNND